MSYKFSAICLKFSSLALFLLLFQTGFGQNLSELDNIADQKQKQVKTDVVLMAANKDTIIYTKDSKLFTALRGQAPIAASSEWLTAALVMAMVDEGKINLDDKVSRYISIFSKYAKNYITIRHCLSHFTGIQSETPGLKKMLEKKKFESLEELVNEFAKKEIQKNPGEEFSYSNIGLSIAGRVLEIVSKKRFDMLAQQKLFRPMGMRQTSFTSLDGGLVDPDAGARSSANDMIRFMTMLLNNGMYKGQRILREASVQELRKLQIGTQPVKNVPNEATGFQYALGAWAAENDGKQATVLMAPSLGGTLPVIDFCRGYAFIIFYKELSADQKANAYKDIKGLLDEKFASNCK
jgi:CubicO group peptidase (beta-lactamase class C family)